MQSNHRGGFYIILSFLVAMGLHILPWSSDFTIYLPNWSLLVLIYWCIALPHRVGVGVGWLCGLFMDVLLGTILGQQALIFTLIAYLTIKMHTRLRHFPIWQQVGFVLLFLLLGQILSLWISGLQGASPETLDFWAPSMIGAALWPVVILLLRMLRLRFKVR